MQNLRSRRACGWTIATLIALVPAGCGGSDDESADTTTGAQQTTTAQTTTPATTKPGGTTQPTSKPSGQGVVPQRSGDQTLEAGGLELKVKVTKVADPVKAFVDEPLAGKKFVGVFVDTQLNRKPQAGDRASASLETTSGTIDAVRIIADGDCGGSFLTTGILETTRPEQGCLGFEVPKAAAPKSITIRLGVTDTDGNPIGSDAATFALSS